MTVGNLLKSLNPFRMNPDEITVATTEPEVIIEVVEPVEAVAMTTGEGVILDAPSAPSSYDEVMATEVVHVIFDVGDGTYFWKSSLNSEFVKKSGLFKSRQEAEADIAAQ